MKWLLILLFSTNAYAIDFPSDTPTDSVGDGLIPTDPTGNPVSDEDFLDFLADNSSESEPTLQCKEIVYDLGESLDFALQNQELCLEDIVLLENALADVEGSASTFQQELLQCQQELSEALNNPDCSGTGSYNLTGLESLEDLTCPTGMHPANTWTGIHCICNKGTIFNPESFKCEDKKPYGWFKKKWKQKWNWNNKDK